MLKETGEASPPGDLHASATADRIPSPGHVIAGKYEVERVLGAGGMGVVVAARHLQLAQRVAIKFMRSEAARDANAADRFLREARTAVSLSSEHVTRVLDVGTLETGEPYMVMEYLDGIDLGQVLHQHGPMPIAEAVGSVLQACEAIAEAHALGIVHRDLKPANLFLSKRRDGSTMVKVLDFGISKVADFNTAGASANLTASGLVMGSPRYMSPEQVRSAKGVDARTDIWALGVILYELIAGVPPFAGDTVGEMLALIVSEKAPPIRQRRPEMPEGLAGVIAQCLERRIERRIQDVGDLASKLVAYGPRNGEGSLERIRRWRAPPSARGGTMTAASGAAHVAETGPPWLKSSGAVRASQQARGWRVTALAAGGVAVVVAMGAYALGGRAGSGPRSNAAVPPTPPNASSPMVPAHVGAETSDIDLPRLSAADAIYVGLLDAGPSIVASPPPSPPSGLTPRQAPKPPGTGRHFSPPTPLAPTKHETDVF